MRDDISSSFIFSWFYMFCCTFASFGKCDVLTQIKHDFDPYVKIMNACFVIAVWYSKLNVYFYVFT